MSEWRQEVHLKIPTHVASIVMKLEVERCARVLNECLASMKTRLDFIDFLTGAEADKIELPQGWREFGLDDLRATTIAAFWKSCERLWNDERRFGYLH